MNRCIANPPRSPRPQDSKAASPQAESTRAANLALFPHRLAPFRPLADVVRIGKVGWRAGIHGHLPEDNTCVPKSRRSLDSPQTPAGDSDPALGPTDREADRHLRLLPHLP